MKNINKIRVEVNAKRWPYQNKSLLVQGKRGNVSFLLETNTKGNIIFTGSYGYISKKVVMQPIIVDKPGVFSIDIDFDSRYFSFKIVVNKKALLEESKYPGASLLVVVRPYTPVSVNLQNLVGVKVKDDSEQFFLRTVHDLQTRFNSSDGYETIKSASLLRLLLLDNPCLVDIINKNYRLRLEYKAADVRQGSNYIVDEAVVFGEYSLYYSLETEKNFSAKTRNAFIKIPCGTVDGQPVTIEDIILYCANKVGGVHYDQSKPNKIGQSNIVKMGMLMKTSDKPIYHELLHQITLLTLIGVKPLVDAVLDAAKLETTL